MNTGHSKRKLSFLKTLDAGDVILLRRFSTDRFCFSSAYLLQLLVGTTFEARQRLGDELLLALQKRMSIFQLLVRSMVRWVIRDHIREPHSTTASLAIISGAPCSGKSSHTAAASATRRVVYDSDADKLRILFLLKMVPDTYVNERGLVEFLKGTGVPIHFVGDYLQPLQRALRPHIFELLAELCYDIDIIGLHSNIASIQATADAFKNYDTSIHLFDIYDKPDEQARRLAKRAAAGVHFAVLPVVYARRAAVAIHQMIKQPDLRRFALQRNAEIRLTSVGSFRHGESTTTTTLLHRRASLEQLPPLSIARFHRRGRANTL